jgi:2-keto-4-pentenoate hydratase/2-oxohepta-3-ene-1,7-dioic acid hydratase in catechol pathway
MKLGTFEFPEGTAIGRSLDDERVLNLSIAAPELPRTVRALLEGGPEMMNRARTAPLCTSAVRSVNVLRYLAPIPNPSKYLAIGMNYKSHLAEAARKGFKIPESQLWFNKQVSCVSGPYDPIYLPKGSNQLDYEAELGVVIGRRCRHVTIEHARDFIAGYIIVNDVSVRDWQMRSPTFTLGKSYDTHGPMGPYLVTADEVEEPQSLHIQLFLNGAIRQDSSTIDMIYGIFEQIAYLSSMMTLEVGDVLATGTPQGVGAAMDPPSYLRAGDRVRISIDQLGHIENRVIAEP